eukprot:3941155-Rhodomonas_salina.1
MCGTEITYGAMPVLGTEIAMCGTGVAMWGTEIAYGATLVLGTEIGYGRDYFEGPPDPDRTVNLLKGSK